MNNNKTEQENFKITKTDKENFNKFCKRNNINKSDFIRKSIFEKIKTWNPTTETTSFDFVDAETR